MSSTRLYESITTYLDEAELTYQYNEGDTDDGVIGVEISGEDGGWRVVIRTTEEGEARGVMIWALLPARIPEKNRLKVAELLTRINCDLAIGNFDMNLDTGEVLFRNSIELADGVFTKAMFDRMYEVNCGAMNDNYAKILNAGYGELDSPKTDAEVLPEGMVLQ